MRLAIRHTAKPARSKSRSGRVILSAIPVAPDTRAVINIVTLSATAAPPIKDASRSSLALSMRTATAINETAKTINSTAKGKGSFALSENRYIKPSVASIINKDITTETANALAITTPAPDPDTSLIILFHP